MAPSGAIKGEVGLRLRARTLSMPTGTDARPRIWPLHAAHATRRPDGGVGVRRSDIAGPGGAARSLIVLVATLARVLFQLQGPRRRQPGKRPAVREGSCQRHRRDRQRQLAPHAPLLTAPAGQALRCFAIAALEKTTFFAISAVGCWSFPRPHQRSWAQ